MNNDELARFFKFNLEYFALMLGVGRDDEARKIFDKMITKCNEEIKDA